MDFRLRIRDLLITSVIFAFFCLIAHCRRTSSYLDSVLPPDAIDDLGAEYDAIAGAIRQGKGFADPFNIETGPTAWMPPVLPYLTAGFYWLSGDNRHTVVLIIATLQGWAVLLTGIMVSLVARRINAPIVGYIAITLTYATHFDWLFQRTHDVWLLLIILNTIWLGVIKKWSVSPRFTVSVVWGIAGGVFALCSPVAGVTWAVCTTVSQWQEKPLRLGQFKRFATIVVVSMLTVAPWIIRNRIVLEAYVPIKSNFAFEFWQAQCCDDDGVLSTSTFLSCHPYVSLGGDRLAHFRDAGEVEFVRSHWPEAYSSLINSPQDYFDRVNHRLAAAFYLYRTHSPRHSSLLLPRFVSLIYCLPTIGMILILVLNDESLKNYTHPLFTIYMTTLVPYILIGYYSRYSAPLAGVQMLLILFGLRALRNRCHDHFKTRREKGDTAIRIDSRSNSLPSQMNIVI